MNFFLQEFKLTYNLSQTEHGVKDLLMIEEYNVDFKSSLGRIQILKIKRVEDVHLQLMTNIRKHLKKTHIEVSEKCLEKWESAFQQYQII